MGPIQPLGLEASRFLDRLQNVQGSTPAEGSQGPGGAAGVAQVTGQTISAMGVRSSVSQMLSSVGVQDNQMLQMMIALLIMMSLLEQQKSGGGSDALSQLMGSSLSQASSSASYSYTYVSTESFSYSYTQFSQISGAADAGASEPQIDTTA